MNERIGQLAEQAGLLGPSSRVGNSHQATEKFAELLVRECADIFGREGTGEYQVDGNWIAKTIKQHFGVES
jgi:hypothetical protein